MGAFDTTKLGTLLVLAESQMFNGAQSQRIVKAIKQADLGPNCVAGTIYDKERLSAPNLWGLVLSEWSGKHEAVQALNTARKRLPNLPILVVGSNDSDTRIAAYEAGADDYVTSTCCDRELSAHVKGLLRRCDPGEDSVSVGDLKVWVTARVAFRAGEPIRLSNKEMELLLYLVAHRSAPASRADILREVFDVGHDPGTNVVEVHIHRLRSKIDGSNDQKLLKTVRGVGYFLDAGEITPANSDRPPVKGAL